MFEISQQNMNYMSEALDLAREAYKNNEVPVGALIVQRRTDIIIASSPNRMREKKNATYHAEILSIMQACNYLQNERLVGCDMYVSLEPCAMCAHAISIARLDRLFFAAEDKKSGGVLNGPKIFESSATHHKPRVISGMYSSESSQLLKDFFKTKRSLLKYKKSQGI
tara:strand:- start:168 stop:668 length:501 start_codon:yes stop_codon:yes gene_type:complete